MRLLSVRPSPRSDKKLVARFDDGTTVHFGARGYGDFTRYWKRDPALAREKRRQYIARHRATENWGDPTRPGTLARYVLWEKPTVLEAVRAYRRRFAV